MQSKLLVDSDVFVSLIDKNDSNHKKTILLNNKLIKQGYKFFALNVVIYETATVLSHKISHQSAVDFLINILSAKMEIIRLDEKTEKTALTIFLEQKRKNTSFIDCANIAWLKNTGSDQIFSYDRVYKLNGLQRIELD